MNKYLGIAVYLIASFFLMPSWLIAEDRHGHEDHAEHDDHTGHDDHEDEALRLEDSTLEEFGIVVAEVGPGDLNQTIKLSGEVAFNADRIAHVSPSVAGIVQQVNVSVGESISAGDVMATLNSRELAAARSEYLAAQARLQLAEETLALDERMLADRIGTERQVRETRQVAREASINANLAEQNLHALGQTHEQIDELRLAEDTSFVAYEMRAPLDGIVTARHLTRGEKISSEPEESPFVIADLSSVWVNLTVYQRDLSAIQQGMVVRIRAGQGIADSDGHIAFVSPALDEHTRTATARVVLDNPEGVWRPGMFINGEVTISTSHSDLVLPRSALQSVDGKTVVFVQHEEMFEPREVELGRQTQTQVEVIAGLQPGDRVVIQNGFALKAEMNRGALEHAGHAH